MAETNSAVGTQVDGRFTVLVVDDEMLLLSAVRRQLPGVNVELVEQPAQALEILAQRPIDLVLSDLNMPKMRGTELLAEIRRRFPEVRRVLMSTDRPKDLDALLTEGSVEHFVEKPFVTPLPAMLDRLLAPVPPA